MRNLLPLLVVCIALIGLPATGQNQPLEDTSAPPAEGPLESPEGRMSSVDELFPDMDLEVRIVLGARSGLAGALPPDLTDMRHALHKRFNYATYSLWNTIHVVAWPDEPTTVQVVPEHFLVVETLAADAERGLVKARVSLYRVPENSGVSREFLAGEHGAVGVKRGRRDLFDPRDFPLLSSPLTVTREEWKAVGGVELWLSADGERLRSTRTTNQSLLTSGGNTRNIGSVKRFLIVGVRIAE